MGDVLHRNALLPHVVELPVMGVGVRFAATDAPLVDLVREIYGRWEQLPAEVITPSSATVHLVLTEARRVPPAATSFRYRMPDATRMLIGADGAEGIADTERLQAIGYVCAELLQKGAELADGLIEPLTLFLLGALDRRPLHAAAIVKDRIAILLEGPSGAGKSTLTYAAQRRGFVPLCDEAVYVQLEPRPRVWGRRARIHLRPEARAHFPELSGLPATPVAGGKTRLVIPSPASPPTHADRVGVCLLRRGAIAQLEPIGPEQVARELAGRIESGFDIYAGAVSELAMTVARSGAWVLTLGDDPHQAAALLDDVAATLAGA